MATICQPRIDELVQSVTLYIPRRLLFHGYVLPFVVLQAAWLYGWIFVYGAVEHYEAGLVGIAVIAIFQIFTCLCCQWSVHVHTFFNFSAVNDPNKATVAKVVPTPNNGSSELVSIHQTDDHQPWFIFQKTKYIWDSSKKSFGGVQFPTDNVLQHYYEWKGHSSENEVNKAEEVYGINKLDIVVPEFWELFRERAIAPFFVFQVFCVALWCLDKYWYYSIFTLVMLITFECTLVQQQLRNMATIRDMGNKPYMINVYRNRRWTYIFSDRLVPGDIVAITRSQHDNLVPCDVLLLRGSCVVDESMLTGESVPQLKEPLADNNPNKQLDLEGEDKIHILYGGTKVVQHTPPSKTSPGLRANDSSCIAYVLRTGFNTSQGKLLRTILFGVKRVTANNLETFGFILFLLVFAIAAASYVWIKGTEDPNRNRYRLFLECTLILTSVVPPELPLELSLAVNSSLMALAKLGIYCTEPFRIPFAGKVEICCFDKTGTLTSDHLNVEGVAGVNGKKEVVHLSDAPSETIQVLATCHSLVQLDSGIVGDPLEKATLNAVNWVLTKSDVVIPKKGKGAAIKIVQRYQFSSALKRMSVLASYSTNESIQSQYIVTVKGAPETLKNMYTEIPADYDAIYLEQTRRGARVLALGYRKLTGSITSQEIRNLKREEIEKSLTFAGFVVISCPLKPDSKSVIKEIQNASHSVVMITGDNPLTACHVSKELRFTKKPIILILIESNGKWIWESVDGEKVLPLVPSSSELQNKNIWDLYALCITGEGLKYLKDHEKEYLKELLPHVIVFARCAPKQKEFIITSLKNLGFTTLMCGDGTNDVGALKHAQVGVAIISSPMEEFIPESPVKEHKEVLKEITNSHHGHNARLNARQQHVNNTKAKIQKWLKEAEDQKESTIVKLGDASIAAPFISKLSSIQCICHVIKQGRCTLVTTLQMFKILALNALVLAYSQSVLYMDNIRFSDFQATLQGVLLAVCFLFISCSKPVKTLSTQRPLPNIFNAYTISTVLCQFLVHFFCLIYMVKEADRISPKVEKPIVNDTMSTPTPSTMPPIDDEENDPFEASIINSTVYIVSLALQISTFAVNYRGRPFMESLKENKALLYSIVGCIIFIMFLSCGLMPDMAEHFNIVDFPYQFRQILVTILVLDFVLALIVDRICRWLFGEGKYRKL